MTVNNMSRIRVTEIIENLEILPLNLQNHVLAIVQALSKPFRKDMIRTNQSVNSLQETAGQRMIKLAGTISDSDLDLMSQAIEEDCGRVDPNEW